MRRRSGDRAVCGSVPVRRAIKVPVSFHGLVRGLAASVTTASTTAAVEADDRDADGERQTDKGRAHRVL
jgi:hypothetical protein